MNFNQLSSQYDNVLNKLGKQEELNKSLDKQVRELNDIKVENYNSIERLFEDNKKLTETCLERDSIIRQLESEKNGLQNDLADLTNELRNLRIKIKSKEEEQVQQEQRQEDINKVLKRNQSQCKETEDLLGKAKNEISELKLSLQKESRARMEQEKINSDLQGALEGREKSLNALKGDLDSKSAKNRQLNEEFNKSLEENEKLKNHILLLTDQNSIVIG